MCADAMGFDAEIDLEATFTCGQLYHWWRDGDRYVTTIGDERIAVRATETGVAVDAPGLERDTVRRFFGLDDDLDAILGAVAVDAPTRRAVERHHGLRLLDIDPWPCIVGFVASQRATVERTTAMVRRLCERHGPTFDETVHGVPSPETLAALEPSALRDIGFGYRADYLVGAARRVADGDVDLCAVAEMPYEGARHELQRLPGVGDKVADCVAIFGLGRRDVVAIDARIGAVIDEHYPELARDGYRETADAFMDRFSPHTSYAQTYLYHDH